MKWVLSILMMALTAGCFGQMVIASGASLSANSGTVISTASSIVNSSSNIDLSKVTLVLASTASSPQGINTTTPLILNSLTAANKTFFGISGQWTVTNNLTFLEKGLVTKIGQITIDGSLINKTLAGTLIYAGSNDLATNPASTSYVVGPLFVTGSSGIRTFPIGTREGYFPARLESISDTDKSSLLGFEVVSSDPIGAQGFLKTLDIKDIFPDRYWEFSVGNGGTFSGNTTVSLDATDPNKFFGTDGDKIVLEKNAAGDQKELGGQPNNTFVTSGIPMSSTGKYYALAKVDEITVKIHKLITPDNDQTNDVLVIDGLDAFPENTVTLIDRWGVPFKTWKGFKNYAQPASTSQDIDFSKLAIGNYICVVEYNERGATKSKKQMISVLK